MTDYNLGRAHGRIDIGYDGSGVRRAQADMASTAAQAAALDAAMGLVNDEFDRNQRVSVQTAEDLVRARGEVERLRVEYKRFQEEYQNAQQRMREAAQAARDVLEFQRDDLDAVREANARLQRAQEEVNAAQARAAQAYDAHRGALAALNIEVERFNKAHTGAAAGFRNMAREAQAFGNVLEGLNEKLSAVARILGQAGLFGLFGGAGAGSLFAMGAGGLQALSMAMSAVVEAANSFVGAVALIPAVANAAVLSVGTLALAFHGVGDALSSIGDPKAFMEAIKDMSPAAQQAMLTIQSFTESFRGARDQLQESLFAPIVADIQPLIMTWLPLLMNTGKQIASVFGESLGQVFDVLQTQDAQQGFAIFSRNLISGFQAARGAIEPFIQAWNRLAEVGSGVFPRLGEAIRTVAENFNAWIQRTAASGQLLDFLHRALDGFTNMGRIVRDVAFGINNVFGIFQDQNGSALENLARMSAEFRAWSQSADGMFKIGNFFELLKIASAAIRPQLDLMGQALAVIGRTLTMLGIAIQPGLNAFFTDFVEALRNLAPYILQTAPAINQFLAGLGDVLLQVVNTVGPQLPQFFATLSEAFVEIMQILPPVVEIFVQLMANVTPAQVQGFLALVGAVKLLSATIPLLQGAFVALNAVMAIGPVGWTVAAIAGLVAAGVLLYNNWDTVKEKFQGLMNSLGGSNGVLNTLKIGWDSIVQSLKNLWNAIAEGTSGGMNVILQELQAMGNQIQAYFAGLWRNAVQWGRNLVTNLANGIRNAVGPILEPVIAFVASMFPDHWKTESPAKTGPMSKVSPNEMGLSVVRNFAAGLSDGTPAVTAAVEGIASEPSALAGSFSGSAGRFSSAGISGQSGESFSKGQSGFEQWVSRLTEDARAWGSIAEQAWSLFESVTGIITDTIRVAANLWNGGDNPLTQPGGLFGPQLPVAQQEVPGVPSKRIPGEAPDQYGRDLASANGMPNQQSVPGVPGLTSSGRPSNAPPGTPPPPPTQTPASRTGGTSGAAGAMTVPLTQRPDGTWTSPDPAWAHLIERESSGISDRQQEIEDENSRRGDPATGLFQITGATWRGAGGEQFAPSAAEATPQQQAEIAARIFGANPNLGGDWGAGRPGRESGTALQAGLTPLGGATPVTTSGGRPATPTPPPSVTGTPGPTVEGFPQFSITDFQTDAKSSRNGVSPDKLLYHTQEGGDGDAMGLAQWMDGMGDRSYNFIIGKDGNVVRPVNPDEAAWSVGPGANSSSINAVIAGSRSDWTAEQWQAAAPQLRTMAALFAQQAVARGIPLEQLGQSQSSGIGGHDWVSEMIGGTDHTDPGPNFPRQEFLNLVRGYAGMLQNGQGGNRQVDASEFGGVAPRGEQAPIDPLTDAGLYPPISGDAPARTGVDPNNAPAGPDQNILSDVLDFTATTGQDPRTPFNPGPRRGEGVDQGGSGGPVPIDQPLFPYQTGIVNRVNRPDAPTGGLPTPDTSGGMRVRQGAPGSYGMPDDSDIEYGNRDAFPAWVYQLGDAFGLEPATYANHQEDGANGQIPSGPVDPNPNSQNRGIDWRPKDGISWSSEEGAARMEALSRFLDDNGLAEQVIFRNANTGAEIGYPNNSDYSEAYPGHENHSHTRFGRELIFGDQGVPITPIAGGRVPTATNAFAMSGDYDDSWMQVPPSGWDLSQPIPFDVLQQNLGQKGPLGARGMSDEDLRSLPPMFYNAAPGSVENVPVPPGYKGQYQVSPKGTISVPTGTGPQPGFTRTQGQNAKSPMDQFTGGMQAASSLVGDGFKIFYSVLNSIDSAASITSTLVRGFENSEDVVGVVREVQSFVQLGADIAKMVSSVGSVISMIGGATGGADFGGTSAAGTAVSGIASIVQASFEGVNAAISLGIDIYHQLGKMGGNAMSWTLGGENTGPLGGNVRMLLNTKTNELYTYAEDNPLNKNTFALPKWQRSYDRPPSDAQQALPPMVNIYTGPGQSPRDMMAESMWLVSSGGGSVASVAGVN